MKKITILMLIFLAIIVTIAVKKTSKETVLEVPYPYVFKMDGIQNKYYCEALVGSVVEASEKTIGGIKRGVRSKAFKGTDKISIEIKGDKMYFLTGASFEAGDSRDENPLNIIYNDEHKILAIDEITDNLIVSIFTLNKDTGIGNWTKVRAVNFFTGNPDSQSYCLKCEPR